MGSPEPSHRPLSFPMPLPDPAAPPSDPAEGQDVSPAAPSGPTAPAPGRHMGELARGDQKWDVYLETRAWADAPGKFHTVNARLHFVAGGRRRSTAWIFIEPSEQALHQRFAMFSPTELWHLVESLG